MESDLKENGFDLLKMEHWNPIVNFDSIPKYFNIQHVWFSSVNPHNDLCGSYIVDV